MIFDTALADFEAAIDMDPGFAAAYAGKADARLFRYWATGAHDDIARARLAISKAIELDSASGYAHAVQCRLLGTYDWDSAGAEAECRRAVDLDPGNDQVRRELAFLLNALGERKEALHEMDAAIALAPTSFNKRSRGLLLYFDRRFDEAIVQLQQVEATDPEYTGASRWIARCLEQNTLTASRGSILSAPIRDSSSWRTVWGCGKRLGEGELDRGRHPLSTSRWTPPAPPSADTQNRPLMDS